MHVNVKQRWLTVSLLVTGAALNSLAPWMTLASWQDITLKGVMYFQVTPQFRRGQQLTTNQPRFTVACCVENTAAAATHHSQLIMLAGRRVWLVSSQQQDPMRGLCDNSSTAGFLLKQTADRKGRAPHWRNTTYRGSSVSKSISVLDASC